MAGSHVGWRSHDWREERRGWRFLRRASCVVALLQLASCGPTATKPLNILLISIDTLRQDHLSGCGYPHGTSPFMDRLAAEGVLFMNAVSTTSWTLPSHCSLMTGLYTRSHGVFSANKKLSKEMVTLAEILAEEGYDTIGYYSTNFVSPGYGLSQGFRVYERHGRDFDQEARMSWVKKSGPRKAPVYVTAGPGLTARVTEWLQKRWSGEPFFMFVHNYDPHWAYMPDPVYQSYLAARDLPRLTAWERPLPKETPADVDEDMKRELLQCYDSEIRSADRNLRHLLAVFEEAGVLERTLVILIADHGEEFLDHGNLEHSQNLYEESLRIPMILRLPGLFEGGRIVTQPVSLVDVLPTVLRLLDLERGGEWEGVALQDVLEGRAERKAVLAELGKAHVSLREPEWKLILDLKSGKEELYSLRDDPGEKENLATTRTEVLQRLKDELQEMRARAIAEPSSTESPALDEDMKIELQALGYVD